MIGIFERLAGGVAPSAEGSDPTGVQSSAERGVRRRHKKRQERRIKTPWSEKNITPREEDKIDHSDCDFAKYL